SSGLVISCQQSIDTVDFPIDTLIIGGFSMDYDWKSQPGLVNWLRANAHSIRRIAAVCLGAFLLAESGLLKNKKATTHWLNYRELQTSYEEILVDPDPIFIKDGNVYTSAGATAGIDMSLSLVQEDHGRDVVLKIAKILVLYLQRPGNQSQFSELLMQQESAKKPIAALQQWIKAHLREPISNQMLAEQVSMSPRNFARVFLAETGFTPAKYIERLRLEYSKRYLEESNDTLEETAEQCGFGTADRMRKIFIRNYQMTPLDYRQFFGKVG
ncbi:MAG: GlxA family transcriptional regulator, partial [Chitinophagaceae bacterium]